ncbi:MAG TPA: tetratricopeptide repeat protein [Planktothrix sp.]|jgi:tetratricopeptide (TPR) repeat protein
MKCDTIPDLERFLAIQEQALGPAAPEVAATLTKLAELYLNKGNLDKAEALYKKAYDITNNARGIHRQGIEDTEDRLNEIRRKKAESTNSSVSHRAVSSGSSSTSHRPVASSSSSTTNTPISTSGFPRNDAMTEAANLRISQPNANGVAPIRASQPNAILSAIEETHTELALLQQMVGEEHPAVADMLTKIADLHCRLRQYDAMEPLLLDALRIREGACGSDHPSLATELKNLGLLYCAQERFEQAEPLIKKAIFLRERALGRSHPRVADLEHHYAQLLRRTNRVALAEALEKHVNEIRNGHDSTGFSRNNMFFNAPG